jgi:hypothetical protein
MARTVLDERLDWGPADCMFMVGFGSALNLKFIGTDMTIRNWETGIGGRNSGNVFVTRMGQQYREGPSLLSGLNYCYFRSGSCIQKPLK